MSWPPDGSATCETGPIGPRGHPAFPGAALRAWSTRICRISRAAIPKKCARLSHRTSRSLISRM